MFVVIIIRVQKYELPQSYRKSIGKDDYDARCCVKMDANNMVIIRFLFLLEFIISIVFNLVFVWKTSGTHLDIIVICCRNQNEFTKMVIN